jgi:hypothetical protein
LLVSPKVGVAPVEPRRVEAPGEQRAAEVGGAVADALLVGEAEHLERERERAPGVAQPLRARDRDQHSQHAVVAPGAAHGVEMRPHQ